MTAHTDTDYRVLLIDDYADVRRMLRMALEDADMEVLEAENGVIGLELAKSEKLDLIITDLLMPEKEGIETIRELRQDDADVPVIAITGGGPMPPDRLIEVAKNLGANAGLSKPVDPDELTELALRLIRERREAGVAA
jgi:CheY-like chemotaxis protein